MVLGCTKTRENTATFLADGVVGGTTTFYSTDKTLRHHIATPCSQPSTVKRMNPLALIVRA